jgi:hypothetical protein
MFDLAQAEVDVRESDLRRVRLGTVDHLRRHVHTDDTSGRTDLSRGEERVESGATPEVEDALAKFEASDSLGIAAAETQIGAFRHRGEVCVRVAELFGGRARRAAATRPAAATTALLFLSRDGSIGLSDRRSNLVGCGCLHLFLSPCLWFYRRGSREKDANRLEALNAQSRGFSSESSRGRKPAVRETDVQMRLPSIPEWPVTPMSPKTPESDLVFSSPN